MSLGSIGRTLWSQLDRDRDADPEPAAPRPTHFPMAGDARLAQVAAGESLTRGARGDSVERFQQALLLAGLALPRWGADGAFGPETAAALRRFQAALKLPVTGALDAKTLAALDEASLKGQRSPLYAKLFADGVLTTTLAIGYDEVGSHLGEIDEVRRGLAARGYRPIDLAKTSAAELARLRITDRSGDYFTRRLTHEGKEVTVVLRLVTPSSPRAKEQFAAGVASDELVLYGGHGRYGSGPDFDDIGSPAGNFVIGAPSSPGHVVHGPSSLAQTTLTDDYQLMFFDACNTFRYMDDLRAVPKNKTTANLDLVGTTTELYWSQTAENVLAMLDGVSSGQTMDQVRDSLDRLNRTGDSDRRKLFMTDGFDDNR